MYFIYLTISSYSTLTFSVGEHSFQVNEYKDKIFEISIHLKKYISIKIYILILTSSKFNNYHFNNLIIIILKKKQKKNNYQLSLMNKKLE